MWEFIKRITFIFILTLCGFTVQAETQMAHVKGRVTLSDRSAAELVVVSITELTQHTLTSETGEFEFTAVPYGTYSFRFNTVQAKEKVITVEVNQQQLSLTVQLDSDSEHLEEVVVKAQSQAHVTKEKGYNMGIVDTKHAELTTLETTALLDRASGIKLRQDGGMGSEVQYNINGLSGNSVRIFIDGISIRNYGSSFSLSSIPSSMIERIEVYKGVVPAHLSEDALGGAVNVVMKKSGVNLFSTSYTYGSFNTHKWDMNGSYRNADNGFTFTGGAFMNHSDNDYKVWGDQITLTNTQTGKMSEIKARRFHDGYQSIGVNGNVGFTNTPWANKFILGIQYSRMAKEIQHGASPTVVYGNRHATQNTAMVNLRYDKINLLPRTDVALYTSYSRNNNQVIDTIADMYNWKGEVMVDPNGNTIQWNKGGGEAGKATDAKNREDNLTGRYRVNYRFLPGQGLSGNLLFSRLKRDVRDSYLSKMEQELTDTRAVNKTVSSLAYDGKFLDEKMNVSFFYKHYRQTVELTDPIVEDGKYIPLHIDRTLSNNGFGGALSYHLTPSLAVSVSAEKAVRLPENSELLGSEANNINPSYDLRPEYSNNFNLGLRLSDFTRGKHAWTADVNFFYRNVNDLIQKGMTTSTDEMYNYENIGKVLSKGVDVDLAYIYNQRLFIETAVSYTDARFNLRYDAYGGEYVYYGDRLRNMPYFTANGNAKYVFPDLFQKKSLFDITYSVNYVHEFFRNWESLGSKGKATIPSQLVHDLGMVYTFPNRKFSVALDARNLFNEQVFDNYALQKSGRAFYMKCTFKL